MYSSQCLQSDLVKCNQEPPPPPKKKIEICVLLLYVCFFFCLQFISHNQEFLTFVATILSGALGSSGSSFSSIDSLRRSSTLEQAGGYTSRPLGAVRPKMLPSGCRPLHTSHPLSAPVANRPLSPHLPLKKPQLSATFSISHRIFGAALGAAIISIPLATKFSLMFDV